MLCCSPLHALRILCKRPKGLSQVVSAVAHFVLQTGGEVIDISGSDVEGHAVFQERGAVASDGVASKLYQKSVNGMRIVLLRRQANNFADSASYRKRLAVGSFTRHRIKCVGQSDDAHRHGNILHQKPIRISRAIASLVMPANNLRNLRPGELDAADNLMADDSVIRHLAKFAGVKGTRLSKDVLVHRNLPDVMQVSGRAQCADVIL